MFCPKCGMEVDEEFDFCPVCGYDLRKVKEKLRMWKEMTKMAEKRGKFEEEVGVSKQFEKVSKTVDKVFKEEIGCEVEIKGVSKDLKKFTGNSGAIKFERLTLEETLNVFAKLPRRYSKKEQKDIEKGKKRPITMIIDREEGTLFIYLNPDGTYMLQGGVRALGTAFDISSNASYNEVVNMIKRFYSDRELFDEWAEEIRQREESEEENEVLARAVVYDDSFPVTFCVGIMRGGIIVGPKEREIMAPAFFCSYDDIVEVKLKKGLLTSGIEIKYYDHEKGKVRKEKFSIEKEGYSKLRNVLVSLIPGKIKY